jgi:hypothetical protein
MWMLYRWDKYLSLLGIKPYSLVDQTRNYTALRDEKFIKICQQNSGCKTPWETRHKYEDNIDNRLDKKSGVQVVVWIQTVQDGVQ